MQQSTILKVVLAFGLTTSLSGCLGGNGNGIVTAVDGGGAAPGSSEYEAAYDSALNIAPTSTMPTVINATYAGQFKAGVNSGSATGVNDNVEILGDLAVAVDWTDGQTTDPFTGTASNIVVTDVASGASETLTGELTVNSVGNTIGRVNTPAQTIGGFAVPETNTGAFSMQFEGRLAGSEGEVDALVGVGGSFNGPNAETMVGGVSGGFKEVGNSDPAIFDAAIGGTAYLNKQ